MAVLGIIGCVCLNLMSCLLVLDKAKTNVLSAHWYDCHRKVFIATFRSSGLRQAAFWGYKWTLVMILSIIGCVSKPSVPSTWAGLQACSVGSSANMISLDCRTGLNVTACPSLIRDSCCWLQRTRTSSWTTSQSKSTHTICPHPSIHPSITEIKCIWKSNL